jgi:hypothetical protein
MFQRRYEREIITLDGMARLEWAGRIASNKAIRMMSNSFHVEQTANYLWPLLLRPFGAGGWDLVLAALVNRRAPLVYWHI